MPIGPRGERLPYPGEPGAGMGAGRGPDLPPMGGGPQMPPIEAVVARIQELQAELQQLVALAEQMGGQEITGRHGSFPLEGPVGPAEYQTSNPGGTGMTPATGLLP